MSRGVEGRRGRLAARLTAVGLALAGLWLVGRLVPIAAAVDRARGWLESAGPLGWVGFVAGYAVAAVLAVPGAALTVLGAVLYGPALGLVLVSAGSTLGAVAAFLVSRTLARERVRRWLADDPRFAALDRAVAERGAVVVLLLRLTPLVPYNVLNYALGLTGVRPVPYAIASWAGMLPMTAALVLLGSALDPSRRPGGLRLATVTLAALGTLAASIYLGRLSRRALGGSLDIQDR